MPSTLISPRQVKEEIRKVSGGDLRKAITYLQSAARLKKDQPIEKQDIFDIAGVSYLGLLNPKLS